MSDKELKVQALRALCLTHDYCGELLPCILGWEWFEAAKALADSICPGTDRVITMDLHATQIQGFYHLNNNDGAFIHRPTD